MQKGQTVHKVKMYKYIYICVCDNTKHIMVTGEKTLKPSICPFFYMYICMYIYKYIYIYICVDIPFITNTGLSRLQALGNGNTDLEHGARVAGVDDGAVVYVAASKSSHLLLHSQIFGASVYQIHNYN